MSDVRAVGNGGVYQFDQATLSAIIIGINRYKGAVTDGANKITAIKNEIESSNIMESNVGDMVLAEISTIATSFNALVEQQNAIVSLLDKYIRQHAEVSDYAAAQAQAADVSGTANKLTAKQ